MTAERRYNHDHQGSQNPENPVDALVNVRFNISFNAPDAVKGAFNRMERAVAGHAVTSAELSIVQTPEVMPSNTQSMRVQTQSDPAADSQAMPNNIAEYPLKYEAADPQVVAEARARQLLDDHFATEAGQNVVQLPQQDLQGELDVPHLRRAA